MIWISTPSAPSAINVDWGRSVSLSGGGDIGGGRSEVIDGDRSGRSIQRISADRRGKLLRFGVCGERLQDVETGVAQDDPRSCGQFRQIDDKLGKRTERGPLS